MEAEILFPYITGIILFIASGIVFAVYRRMGVIALLYLSLGFLFVGLESVLDGYEASQVIGYGGWNNIEKIGGSTLSSIILLDAIRGVFIVLWAGMEVLFAMSLGGAERKSFLYGIPGLIIVGGIVETFALNYSHITPLEDRIFMSSAIRVLGILVPVALITGGYLLASLYRELGAKSVLFFGLGFLVHGLTLPTYSFAKELGAATLGLWYLFGGIVPSLLASYGAILLEKESKEAEVEE